MLVATVLEIPLIEVWLLSAAWKTGAIPVGNWRRILPRRTKHFANRCLDILASLVNKATG